MRTWWSPSTWVSFCGKSRRSPSPAQFPFGPLPSVEKLYRFRCGAKVPFLQGRRGFRDWKSAKRVMERRDSQSRLFAPKSVAVYTGCRRYFQDCRFCLRAVLFGSGSGCLFWNVSNARDESGRDKFERRILRAVVWCLFVFWFARLFQCLGEDVLTYMEFHLDSAEYCQAQHK